MLRRETALRPTFEQSLRHGRIAEGKIAEYLRRRGFSVIPAYEKEIGEGKGPQVFTPVDELVAPDLFVVRNGVCRWVEAKCKTVFTWHRKSRRWVTGIDLRHYNEYQKVGRHFGWEVYLLFLHTCPRPDPRDVEGGCPAVCPTGLFEGRLSWLTEHENHRHDNWGRSGMVYWAHERLRPVAPVGSTGEIQ